MDDPIRFGYMKVRPVAWAEDGLLAYSGIADMITFELNDTFESAIANSHEAEEDLEVLRRIAVDGVAGESYHGPEPAWKVGLMAVHLAAIRTAVQADSTVHEDGDRLVAEIMRRWIFHPAAEAFVRHVIDEFKELAVPGGGAIELSAHDLQSARGQILGMSTFYRGVLQSWPDRR